MLLLLLFLDAVGSSSLPLRPVVIDRSSHVDWEELLLEYNYHSSPEDNVTVTAAITSFCINDSGEPPFDTLLDVRVNWTDSRLQLPSGFHARVPNTVKIWRPDLDFDYVVECNTLRSHLEASTVISKEGYPVTHLKLIERKRCSLICIFSVGTSYLCKIELQHIGGPETVTFTSDSVLFVNHTTTHDFSNYIQHDRRKIAELYMIEGTGLQGITMTNNAKYIG